MKFLEKFNKEVDKIEGVSSSSTPPNTWYSTGNYVLNKIISGSFHRGIPESRITAFAGPSGAGKSFMIGNVVKGAQEDGTFVLVLDSENALDDDYMKAIGVNVDDESKYDYKSISTIDQCNSIISSFMGAYHAEYGRDNPSAPKILIVIDSLDMMMTESETKNFQSGDMKGDQGQRAKQLKQMLRNFTNAIKGTSVGIAITTQVYRATHEQLLAGEDTWVVNNAIKFALSQIVLLTKLKLRDEKAKDDILGIRMKCECLKTRFTKPFQKVVIEVPYDTGINKYSGLLEPLVGMGILDLNGAWYTIRSNGVKFQKSAFYKYADQLLEDAEQLEHKTLHVSELLEEDDENLSKEELSVKRKSKIKGSVDSKKEELM